MSDIEISQPTVVDIPAPKSDVVETKFSNEGRTVSAQPVVQPAATASKLDNLKLASTKADLPDPSAVTPPPVPAYQPNFKIKVDKQEKDMDELFRVLIKDKDTEEKVRNTLQKSEAFDAHMQRHENLKAEHDKVTKNYNGIDKSLRQLTKFLNEDDMESYCSALKIDDAKVLRYAQRILQKLEMDPNQRAEQDRVRNDRLRAHQLEEQNTELVQSFQLEQARTGLMQTEMLLGQPQFANIAASFDNQAKRQGAFLEAICTTAANVERSSGVVLTPQEAIQETLKVWGPFIPQSQGQPQLVQPPGQQAPPPTLPNVSGRATSPIKQGPRSVADLKKLANQF